MEKGVRREEQEEGEAAAAKRYRTECIQSERKHSEHAGQHSTIYDRSCAWQTNYERPIAAGSH
eukprot:386460-Pyramimonas_sp.AAC.1